ncbi:hypothetical protein OHT20_17725 [Streptomyces caniferus]|uniref:hypothetical protein n=1 Tax=Streptomyces caniferus TaxID=285557 RepID=UPI002E2C6B25|nr:hypothetical protein [Streptomyces caniferus]
MNTDAVAGRRGIGQLLALCAVLLGLFLMHGAPATAAEGCHGTMSAPTAIHEHDAPALASGAPAAMAHPGAVQAQAVDAAGMEHGTSCVSTPARDHNPLLTAGLVAVAAFTTLAAFPLTERPWHLARTRRREPPRGGRSLLLQVCIART